MGDRAGAKLLRQMCHYQKCSYVTTLNASSGRATSTMEFSHYAELLLISEAVIKSKRKRFKKMSQKLE
jgi:translation elongation factor EF-G